VHRDRLPAAKALAEIVALEKPQEFNAALLAFLGADS